MKQMTSENSKSLAKMLENTKSGIHEAKRIRKEGFRENTLIEKTLSEGTVLQQSNGNVLEPLPKKFSIRANTSRSSSSLQKIMGSSSERAQRINSRANVGHTSKPNAERAGAVTIQEETEDIPATPVQDPYAGGQVHFNEAEEGYYGSARPTSVSREEPFGDGIYQDERMGILGQPTPTRLDAEELYVQGYDDVQSGVSGQPPAKVSATPGKSGSSEVFRNPTPPPNPSLDKASTIAKIRKLAGMSK